MTDETRDRRLLTRRRALGLIGAAGVAGIAAAAGCGSDDKSNATATATPGSTSTATSAATATASPLPTSQATATAAATTVANVDCIVRPALTEGPYFVDELLNRSDVRTDPTNGAVSDGAQLDLAMRVFTVGDSCTPLAGAHVDIWHCDASGRYSDESANNTVGQKFLRGYQVTDDNGNVAFTTIVPGWYMGRAPHIHFKIRTYDGTSKTYEFTSQLFFDPALTAQVYQQTPYSTHGTTPDTSNAQDSIYQQSGGQTLLTLTPSGDSYSTAFGIGLQM